MIRMQLNFEHVEEWYVLYTVVKKSKDEKQIKMHIKQSVVLLYFIIVLFFRFYCKQLLSLSGFFYEFVLANIVVLFVKFETVYPLILFTLKLRVNMSRKSIISMPQV